MLTVLIPDFNETKSNGGSRRSVLCNNDVLEILQREVWMAGNKEVVFNSYESVTINVDSARDYPVHSNWFEDAQRNTELRMICSGMVKLYWNEKIGNGP